MGPVSDIIVSSEIDEKFEVEFRSFIISIGAEFYGNDIVFKGGSFLFGFGWSYPEEISEYSHLESKAVLKPRGKIHISANCNGQDDHRHLGELCYAVVSKYDGVLEFCDELKDRTDDSSLLEHPEHYSNGYTSQFGPGLMKVWLGHNDFHMVK